MCIADSLKVAFRLWEAILWWSLKQIIALYHTPKGPMANYHCPMSKIANVQLLFFFFFNNRHIGDYLAEI